MMANLPPSAAHSALTPPSAASIPAPQGVSPVVQSDQLLQGRPSIHIAHNGTVYRLQATRQGKLILTK